MTDTSVMSLAEAYAELESLWCNDDTQDVTASSNNNNFSSRMEHALKHARSLVETEETEYTFHDLGMIQLSLLLLRFEKDPSRRMDSGALPSLLREGLEWLSAKQGCLKSPNHHHYHNDLEYCLSILQQIKDSVYEEPTRVLTSPAKKKSRFLYQLQTLRAYPFLVALLCYIQFGKGEIEETNSHMKWTDLTKIVHEWMRTSFFMDYSSIRAGMALYGLLCLTSSVDNNEGGTMCTNTTIGELSAMVLLRDLQMYPDTLTTLGKALGLSKYSTAMFISRRVLAYDDSEGGGEEEDRDEMLRSLKEFLKRHNVLHAEDAQRYLVIQDDDNANRTSTCPARTALESLDSTLSTHVTLLLVLDQFSSVCKLLRIMEQHHKTNAMISEICLVECWQQTLDYLRQSGMLFLDGNHIDSANYAEKRKQYGILLNSMYKGGIGMDTLSRFFQGLIEEVSHNLTSANNNNMSSSAITLRNDDIHEDVRRYVTLASQQTLLKLLRDKYQNDTQAIDLLLELSPMLQPSVGSKLAWAVQFIQKKNPIPPALVRGDAEAGELDLVNYFQTKKEEQMPAAEIKSDATKERPAAIEDAAEEEDIVEIIDDDGGGDDDEYDEYKEEKSAYYYDDDDEDDYYSDEEEEVAGKREEVIMETSEEDDDEERGDEVVLIDSEYDAEEAEEIIDEDEGEEADEITDGEEVETENDDVIIEESDDDEADIIESEEEEIDRIVEEEEERNADRFATIKDGEDEDGAQEQDPDDNVVDDEETPVNFNDRKEEKEEAEGDKNKNYDSHEADVEISEADFYEEDADTAEEEEEINLADRSASPTDHTDSQSQEQADATFSSQADEGGIATITTTNEVAQDDVDNNDGKKAGDVEDTNIAEHKEEDEEAMNTDKEDEDEDDRNPATAVFVKATELYKVEKGYLADNPGAGGIREAVPPKEKEIQKGYDADATGHYTEEEVSEAIPSEEEGDPINAVPSQEPSMAGSEASFSQDRENTPTKKLISHTPELPSPPPVAAAGSHLSDMDAADERTEGEGHYGTEQSLSELEETSMQSSNPNPPATASSYHQHEDEASSALVAFAQSAQRRVEEGVDTKELATDLSRLEDDNDFSDNSSYDYDDEQQQQQQSMPDGDDENGITERDGENKPNVEVLILSDDDVDVEAVADEEYQSSDNGVKVVAVDNSNAVMVGPIDEEGKDIVATTGESDDGVKQDSSMAVQKLDGEDADNGTNLLATLASAAANSVKPVTEPDDKGERLPVAEYLISISKGESSENLNQQVEVVNDAVASDNAIEGSVDMNDAKLSAGDESGAPTNTVELLNTSEDKNYDGKDSDSEDRDQEKQKGPVTIIKKSSFDRHISTQAMYGSSGENDDRVDMMEMPNSDSPASTGAADTGEVDGGKVKESDNKDEGTDDKEFMMIVDDNSVKPDFATDNNDDQMMDTDDDDDNKAGVMEIVESEEDENVMEEDASPQEASDRLSSSVEMLDSEEADISKGDNDEVEETATEIEIADGSDADESKAGVAKESTTLKRDNEDAKLVDKTPKRLWADRHVSTKAVCDESHVSDKSDSIEGTTGKVDDVKPEIEVAKSEETVDKDQADTANESIALPKEGGEEAIVDKTPKRLWLDRHVSTTAVCEELDVSDNNSVEAPAASAQQKTEDSLDKTNPGIGSAVDKTPKRLWLNRHLSTQAVCDGEEIGQEREQTVAVENIEVAIEIEDETATELRNNDVTDQGVVDGATFGATEDGSDARGDQSEEVIDKNTKITLLDRNVSTAALSGDLSHDEEDAENSSTKTPEGGGERRVVTETGDMEPEAEVAKEPKNPLQLDRYASTAAVCGDLRNDEEDIEEASTGTPEGTGDRQVVIETGDMESEGLTNEVEMKENSDNADEDSNEEEVEDLLTTMSEDGDVGEMAETSDIEVEARDALENEVEMNDGSDAEQQFDNGTNENEVDGENGIDDARGAGESEQSDDSESSRIGKKSEDSLTGRDDSGEAVTEVDKGNIKKVTKEADEAADALLESEAPDTISVNRDDSGEAVTEIDKGNIKKGTEEAEEAADALLGKESPDPPSVNRDDSGEVVTEVDEGNMGTQAPDTLSVNDSEQNEASPEIQSTVEINSGKMDDSDHSEARNFETDEKPHDANNGSSDEMGDVVKGLRNRRRLRCLGQM